MARYDIAVVGMGCIVPSANNVSKYWDNIVSGDTYITPMPERIWHMKHYFSSDHKNSNKTYTMHGAFIEGFQFPFAEYRLPPKAMQGMDPAQLITLEATKEALRDAGLDFFSPQLKEGVTIIGSSGVDGFAHATIYLDRINYFNKIKEQLQAAGVPEATMNLLFEEFSANLKKNGHTWNPAIASVSAIASSVSNRVAQVFGVAGFNMTVDAACGSSFVAIDVACQALMAGDARIAIAGGTDLGTNPAIYIGFSDVDGLSEDGTSNPFDASANGLVIGEGCGIVVLKRLEDALADGDHIHAVIRGMASSSDGAGQAIYAPSVAGRARALKSALKHAEVAPHQVQYVEAHATSTVVGDANEYDAISTAYGDDPDRKADNPLYLGSVKGQIGHLKAAAGVAGMIKAVLAMEHGKIPHQPKFRNLTPKAQKVSNQLVVPTKIVPWQPQADGSRYAAVTSSGFGGVNYHMILEQRPVYKQPPARAAVCRDIAIVGTTVRVAGATSPEEFWQNISTGRNTFSPVDPVKMGWAEHYYCGPEGEKITTKTISLIDDYKTDCIRYKILPKSVDQISPTQFLALDLADRLLTGAGMELKEPKNVAVCIGSMHDDYYPAIQRPMVCEEYAAALSDCPTAAAIDGHLLQTACDKAAEQIRQESPRVSEHTLPGWMTNITSGRVANKLNCMGPNFTVDTACSSGLAALIPATYQLMFGDVDEVISGGLNRQTSFSFTSGVCALGAVAEEVARPYDENGKGFLISEGGIFFLLKRLEDAKRDGDRILTVIRGVDGASEIYNKSMVAPTEQAASLALKRVLAKSHVDPQTIGVAETHGSANKASDLVEARSIANEIRPEAGKVPVYITAAKSHVGHLYGGSGATSVLSTALAINHGQAPGIRNLQNLRHELVPIKDRVLPIAKTTELLPEMTSGAITSLGLGGAEYAVIISRPEVLDKPQKSVEPQGEKVTEKPVSLAVRHESTTALSLLVPGDAGRGGRRAADLAAASVFLCACENLASLPQTLALAVQRTPISTFVTQGTKANYRLTVTFNNEDELRAKLGMVLKMLIDGRDLKPMESQGIFLADRTDESIQPLVFCFPGQGTHYMGMARFLYEENGIFKRVVDQVHDMAMAEFGFDLVGHIYGDPQNKQLAAELGSLVGAMMSLFAVEQGMAQVLTSIGVRPDYLIGHSFGEFSALVYSGVWDLETGFRALVARIKAAEEILGSNGPKLGMMSFIGDETTRDALLATTGGRVVLTNINAPGRFILGGELSVINELVPRAQAAGADVKVLPIATAFHSKYMEAVREPFMAALRKLPCNKPLVPIMSTVTGKFIDPDWLSSENLAQHLGNQLITPINFPRDVEALYASGARHFVEVGPGWSMSKMVSGILGNRQHRAFPTIHPKIGDREVYNRAMALLVAYGHLSSAADRKNQDGIFNSEFMEYMRTNEPAVLHLLEEVHQRYLQQFIQLAETTALKAAPASAPAALTAPPAVTKIAEEKVIPVVEKAVADVPPVVEQKQLVVAAAPKAGKEEWAARLKERLVEKSGYPADMLEDNLDLEADLGIDSVQRAEVWMGLVKDYNLDPELRPEGSRTIAGLAESLAKAGGEAPATVISQEQAVGQMAAMAAPVTKMTAAQAAAPVAGSRASTISPAEWTVKIKDRLAESSGYPVDMLDENLDLEAELGIDSVQRAELWMGMVRDYALDPTMRPEGQRTIAALAAGLSEAAKGNHGVSENAANPPAPSPEAVARQLPSDMQAAVPSPVAEKVVAGSSSKEEWAARLKERLVEKSGYPADMLEDNLDLEADLGIDSVQRAEVWMGLVKDYNLDPELRPEGSRTIASLAESLAKAGGKVVIPEAGVSPSYSMTNQQNEMSAPLMAPASVSANSAAVISPAEWMVKIKDRLAESSGYPVDMLDENLDLEAELGIDSVQRAELWMGMVRDYSLDPTMRPEGQRTIAALAAGLSEAAKSNQDVSENSAGIPESSPEAVTQQLLPGLGAVARPPMTANVTAGSASKEEWAARLKERLVEKSGYPADMLEDNLDLEADLGIDSVQRAEVWMGLVKDYNLDPNLRPEGSRTIAGLAESLAKGVSVPVIGETAKTKDGSEAEKEITVPFDLPARHVAALEQSPNQLYVSTVVPVEAGALKAEACHKVLMIVGRTQWGGKVARLLSEQGIEVSLLKAQDLLDLTPVQLSAHLLGVETIIYVAHRDLYGQKGDSQKLSAAVLKETATIYAVFKALAAELNNHAYRVIVPIAMDGAFGCDGQYESLFGSFPAGFVRCLRREITTSRFLLLDGGDNWAEALLAVVPYESAHFELGYSRYGLVTPVLSQVSKTEKYEPVLAKGDTVVVTGGARGIVFECVLALAEATGCRLILTGRTAQPAQADWFTVAPEEISVYLKNFELTQVRTKQVKNIGEAKRLSSRMRSQWEVNRNLERARKLGIDVEYHVCDVSDSAAFCALLQQINAVTPIKGLVQGAGVQKSNLLAELSEEQINATLMTKISPMLDMITTLDMGQIKLLSVFSSIAGLFGNAGQTDYALANDMLDCFVHWLSSRYPQLSARAIQWTAWVGTGMVTEAQAKRFADSGLVPLDVPSGVALYVTGVTGSNWEVLSALNRASAFADSRRVLDYGAPAKGRKWLLATGDGQGQADVHLDSALDVYLDQHRVQHDPVMPGTFVAELFAEATVDTGMSLSHVRIRRPVRVLKDHLDLEVLREGDELKLLPKERPANLPEKALENLVFARCHLVPRQNDSVAASLQATAKDIEQLRREAQNSQVTFYGLLDSNFSDALKTGPIFRGIKALTFDAQSCQALMVLTEEARHLLTLGATVWNPVMADMAVQAAAAWTMQVKNVMAIPFDMGLVQFYRPVSRAEAICSLSLVAMDAAEATMDVAVRDIEGNLLFTIDKLVLRTIQAG